MGDFSVKLRKLRQSRGYTQAQVASFLGISPSAVGMYEQGRREPDMELIGKICDLYNVSPNYLVSEGNDAPSEINDVINSMREQLRQSDGLMFNGVPVSAEDTEKIFDAMQLAAQLIMVQQAQKEQEECAAISGEELNN